MVAPAKSKLDGNQVLQHAFDEATGRLRTDTSVSVSGPAAAVVISHLDDSIRLGDGVNFLTSTTVGSKLGLDINIINKGQLSMGNSVPVVIASDQTPIDINLADTGIVKSVYNEVLGIASGIETTITTYTTIIPNAYILLSKFNGTNIASYRIKINGTTIDKKYTYFSGPLSGDFNFLSNIPTFPGISLTLGDVVTITVEHDRPTPGDFNGSIQVFEAN